MKIGVVCLFIMTKFEDGKILSFSLFQNIFNGNLTREEYHQIEGDILKSVGYMVNIETVLDAHSLFETQIETDQSKKDLFLELYYFITLSGLIQIKPYYISLACHSLILEGQELTSCL